MSKVSRFWSAVILASAALSTTFAAAQAPERPQLPGVGQAQPGGAGAAGKTQAEIEFERRMAAPTAPQATAEAPLPPQEEKKLNLWELANNGGPLMYPIFACSVLVVLFAFERWLGLRRRKLMPPALMQELGELSKRQGGVDPRAAYKACMKYPSTASTVIRAVLLKIGRPHAELEQTLREVNEREAAKLYKNVRPIELQASVAPLLGLLGTVQGMIWAFFVTANAAQHANRGEKLAEGIYMALVTTFAGLCVAIPAAVLAHYFEGKIQSLFRDLDEFVLGMLPQWERFEGKLRVNRQTLAGENNEGPAAHAPAPNTATIVDDHPSERMPKRVEARS